MRGMFAQLRAVYRQLRQVQRDNVVATGKWHWRLWICDICEALRIRDCREGDYWFNGWWTVPWKHSLTLRIRELQRMS
jgi:hypothetical protein